MTRKLFIILLLGIILAGASGCVIPAYSGDPLRRNQQLLNDSEGLRTIYDEWERFWMIDQPSHLTPYRTHGGII